MSFFSWVSEIWDRHGWTIILVTSLIVILVAWLIDSRFRAKGTYSTFMPGRQLPMAPRYRPGPVGTGPVGGGMPLYDPRAFKVRNNKKIVQNSKGEIVCKQYLERLFQRPFQKVRPPFLYNTVTGENLELDMYNPDINLAVEYNGRQHYEYIPFFHGNSRDKFMNQKYRDEKKADACAKNNIPLIIVPYTVPLEKIPDFLYSELKKLGKVK